MDRYERIIRDIWTKTKESDLNWVVVPVSQVERFLGNPSEVLRAFEAHYNLKGKAYELLFAERRTEVLDEYDRSFERFSYRLLVLGHDGEIVLDLFEGLVDREDLLRLAAEISDRNDRAREFFDAFDASNV